MNKAKCFYSDEKNVQILIALLKQHNLHDVVVSPGATNDCFVLSIQDDPDFNLYSAVDERHAGYFAIGLAQEKGCPVIINCTGATASRNYMSALTEAYYRKIPIVAITCSQHSSHIGNLYPQMTDRLHLPKDVALLSVQCPVPHTDEEEWSCQLNVNKALLETKHRGGGPVHINLETDFSGGFSVSRLPDVQKISRVFSSDKQWPELPANAKIVIWIGAHAQFSLETKRVFDQFVSSHNVVVLTDLTSNYCGQCAVRSSLLLYQRGIRQSTLGESLRPDIIIHIGEVSGDYPTMMYLYRQAPVWRVCEDGELRDRLQRLSCVFEMSEECFFDHYSSSDRGSRDYYELWKRSSEETFCGRPEVVFSGLWIARRTAEVLPENVLLHLGIFNPLRCWNMTAVEVSRAYSMVGGFGIDGGLSSLIGTAMAVPDKVHFGVFGDLAFFYDLNSLGSRHVSKNLRILLVNNGEGGEFSIPDAIADNPICGDRVHSFIAAKGHNGRQSQDVVKCIAKSFGFDYLAATSKESFDRAINHFISTDSERPIIFECFTNVRDDADALRAYQTIRTDLQYSFSANIRLAASKVIPDRVKNILHAAVGR